MKPIQWPSFPLHCCNPQRMIQQQLQPTRRLLHQLSRLRQISLLLEFKMYLKLVQSMPDVAELLLYVMELLLDVTQLLLGVAQETPTIELKLKLGSARLRLPL